MAVAEPQSACLLGRVVVRVLRIGAPLAAAAVVAVAIWTQTASLNTPNGAEGMSSEQDLEAVLASDEWSSELDAFDALLEELDELESALALDWSDDLALLTDDFDFEETTQ